MASQLILNANTPSAPMEILGDATLYPDGTFAGGHIVLRAAPEEAGPYRPVAYYYDNKPKNLSLSGGGWISAEPGNLQPQTLLGLRVNTLS